MQLAFTGVFYMTKKDTALNEIISTSARRQIRAFKCCCSFLLAVKMDTPMAAEGIAAGDFVIVEVCPKAQAGDLALIPGKKKFQLRRLTKAADVLGIVKRIERDVACVACGLLVEIISLM